MKNVPETAEQLADQLLGTATPDLLSLIDTWCAKNPGCVAHLDKDERDPLDDEEAERAAREQRIAFMFIDEEPLPPPHADIWVYGVPVVVRANVRAVPRLKVLTDDPQAPAVFPDGSRAQLGRSDQLRAAAWLVRALRERARTFETVVRAIVALRPEIATATDPRTVAPLLAEELARSSKLDAALVHRIAGAVRFRTPNAVVAVAIKAATLTFRAG